MSSDGHIRPATAAAAHDFEACGGRVGFATGRTDNEIAEFVAAVRPDLPMVLYNGAYVLDLATGSTLRLDLLPPVAVESAVTFARSNGLIRGVVVHGKTVARRDRATPEFDDFLTRTLIQAEIAASPAALYEVETPIKVLFYVKSVDQAGFISAIGPLLPKTVRTVATSPETVEVISAASNKRDGIEAAIAKSGIRMSEVIAFGDADNDVEMLAAAGLGVAIDHCTERACAAATVRAGSNDSDTIAEIIRKVAMGLRCGEVRPPNPGASR